MDAMYEVKKEAANEPVNVAMNETIVQKGDPQVFYPDPDQVPVPSEEIPPISAEEFLNRGRLLKERVIAKFQQIDELDAMTKNVTSRMQPDVVSRTRDVTANQEAIIRLMEAREELGRQANEFLDVRKEIADVIAQVRNPRYSLVLEKRYLCNMKLEDIATDLNCDVSWVKKSLRKAMEIVRELLSHK